MGTKKIIGLLGSAGSGKDTVARYIKDTLSDTIALAFAEPLKEFAKEVFDFPSENLYGSSSKRNEIFTSYAEASRWKTAQQVLIRFAPTWCAKVQMTYERAPAANKLLDKVTEWFFNLRAESLDKGLSCRRLLQTLGTECGRAVNTDIWVNYGLHRAHTYMREAYVRCVVITDLRFINEAKILKEKEGEIWFLDRPVQGLEGEAGQHASEAAIRTLEMQQMVTRTLKNAGSLDDLRTMVRLAVDEVFDRHPEWET